MGRPVRVILVTDGDKVARRALEHTARQLGLRCISASAGNPTPLSGAELVALIKEAAHDPVLVMVDDKGNPGRGSGESAMEYIATSPEVRVLGAIAVASNTTGSEGTTVDYSVTWDGQIINHPVDKDGMPQRDTLLKGDTVDVLRDLHLPVVIGIGDPGKMHGADALSQGCKVSSRAIAEVLSRSDGELPAASHDRK